MNASRTHTHTHTHTACARTQDKKASQSMEGVLSVMRLNGIVRTAASLMRGCHIRHDEQSIALESFSVFGWFKVGRAATALLSLSRTLPRHAAPDPPLPASRCLLPACLPACLPVCRPLYCVARICTPR
jgi:hypothetical protein